MPEKQNIEWKESWHDEYLKWIGGFANAEGGILHIGRNDKGVVVGLSNAKKLLEDIPNKVRDVLGILVEVNLKTEKGKEYLEIVVDPYPYPVSYKGQYHVRSGSTKQELKGSALNRFILKRLGKTWDSVPVPDVRLSDFDRSTLKSFRKLAAEKGRVAKDILAEKDAALLDKLKLKDGEDFKRAAVLLFHPDPERFFTGAYVKIGYFQSNSNLLFHDEIHGDLFTQVEKTLDLIVTKYLKASIHYEGIYRVERFPVPEDALRETLLNAVAHKDYASCTPIQISVYADKIMFWNSARLPDGWTVQNLLSKHSSEPFNPDIANTFFRAGMIETWGRGIELILEACQRNESPEPVLTPEVAGLWVTFPFSEEYLARIRGEKPVGKTNGETVVKTRVKPVVKTKEKILVAIKHNNKITVGELAEMLGLSKRGVEWQLRNLKKDGLLVRIGPVNGGHWEIAAVEEDD